MLVLSTFPALCLSNPCDEVGPHAGSSSSLMMHAQAKPAGRKLKNQQSHGASGPADDAANEAANPDPERSANPSVADHEGANRR